MAEEIAKGSKNMIQDVQDSLKFSSLQNIEEDLQFMEFNILKNSYSTGVDYQENYFEDKMDYDQIDLDFENDFDFN